MVRLSSTSDKRVTSLLLFLAHPPTGRRIAFSYLGRQPGLARPFCLRFAPESVLRRPGSSRPGGQSPLDDYTQLFCALYTVSASLVYPRNCLRRLFIP